MCVRMVMKLLKGVNSRKKKVLSLSVSSLAPIQNYYKTKEKSLLMLLSLTKLALSGYLAASMLIFAIPSIIHKPHQYYPLFKRSLQGKHILKIAHRGGSKQIIENTIEAFEASRDMTDMFQMDVCETKDGILVVHHDKSLLRTCGVDKEVGDVLLCDLPKFQKEVERDFCCGKEFVICTGQKIPTLEEVFECFPGMSMNVQIKAPSLTAIKELQRLIQKYKRTDITFIGTKSPFEATLEKQFPQSSRFFSYGRLPRLYLLYFFGLLPFVTINEKVLQIPLLNKEYKGMRIKSHGEGWFSKMQFLGLQIAYYLLQPLIWHLKKRGVMVFYWVCNEPQDFQKALKGGCCGIMTDKIQLLQRYLNDKKL